jgi:hypothetical protein
VVDSLYLINFKHNGPMVSNFTFWGFIFILLPGNKIDVVREFVDTELPDKRSYVWILGVF